MYTLNPYKHNEQDQKRVYNSKNDMHGMLINQYAYHMNQHVGSESDRIVPQQRMIII